MKILIIDDNPTRLTTLRNALLSSDISSSREPLNNAEVYIPKNDIDDFCNEVIKLAKESITSLYFYIFKIIEENNIDIIFTDLSLKENIEINTEEATTGEQLILNLIKNDLHKKLPIIAYSRNLDDSSQLNDPYKLLGKGIRYIALDSDSDDASSVRDAIFGEISVTDINSFIYEYKEKEFSYNIACLCALDIEFEPIKDLIQNSKEILENNQPYLSGYIENKSTGIILKAIGRSMGDEYGPIEARSESDTILDKFKPKYITMTGVAGGHKDNVNLGDVVIVRHTFEWEEVKHDEYTLPRFNPQVTDKTLKNIIKEFFVKKEKEYLQNHILENYKNKNEIINLIQEAKKNDIEKKVTKPHSGKLKYQFAPVATGSSVINNESKMNEIKKHQDKFSALDMEIFSLYTSAYKKVYNVKALAIKGIVDYGDGNKEKKWQQFASYASAQTLYKLFTEYVDVVH